jgi:hypothetical protein
MILLDDVVEVLDLAHLNRHDLIFVHPVYGRFVGVTHVHSGLLQTTVLAYAFSKIALPQRYCAWHAAGWRWCLLCQLHSTSTFIDLDFDVVASMRQLSPTARMCFLKNASSIGKNLITQWLTLK